jgi:DNA repair photolyase
MMARSYGKIKRYEEWLHPKIVGNTLELLEKEIPKFKKEIDFVHMSFTTDPFMFDALNQRVFPAVKELTLKIIERLNRDGLRSTVLTKGIYPRELADTKRFGSKNRYGITLVSLDDKFAKKYEPYSSPIKERIESLKYLHNHGLKTWASIEPYPTPNIVDQDLTDILDKLSFVNDLIFGKMNYNKAVNGYFENEKFYLECVHQIQGFCSEKGISFHIKKGTPGNDDKTKKIFSGCDLSQQN